MVEETKEKGKEKEEKKLIKMVRDGDVEPKTADVHPDMVEAYKKGGWRIAKQ